MKIKVKLFLGVGLLFVMVMLLTILGGVYVNKLSVETKNILVANYNTLDYSRQMLISLNDGIQKKENADKFFENLTRQQNNITEPGEKEYTDQLTKDFNILKKAYNDSIFRKVNEDITNVMLLNMHAIQRKSMVATATADKAIFWITLVGTCCFLIAFVLLMNLPGNVANPIKKLTESIKEIADQNYSERVHFEKHNEFGELANAFNTMAQKLEEYRAGNLEKLMIEKKRIETLINNMKDPVFGVDDNNRILFMNEEAGKISGLKNNNVLGKQIQDVAVNNDLIRSLISGLFMGEGEIEMTQAPMKIFANNKESYFEKHIIPIKITPTGESHEKLIGNVILLRNITSYKELDFAKTNFIATVSHELKTPISSIKMSTELLKNSNIGLLNEEQSSLVESIKEDAVRLLKITGELLNMTQIETGVIQLSVKPTPIKNMVEYAINANRLAAEQKQIKFYTQDTMPVAMVDNEKTAWVLTNLISNAIRYSYENSVVSISTEQDDNYVKITVKDNGQGIPPQYLEKVFDRYFRIPGTRKEGTGLGLSISKEFIEAQGGKIFVESEFGSGTAFTIALPRG